MSKKQEALDEDMELSVSNEAEAPAFITHDFHREDLNDLRDKVNEHTSLLKA